MPIPTTNLFKGDRVTLSKSYTNRFEMMAKESQSGTGLLKKNRGRVGTIVTDTLNKRNNYIQVHWDGNAKANNNDLYMPDDLVLVEEGIKDVNPVVQATISWPRRPRAATQKGQPSWYGSDSTLRK